MINKIKCNLCSEISGVSSIDCGIEYQKLVLNKKNIILSSERFIVVPSVGPLNHSHVMLVPIRHVNSFAELSKSEIDEGFTLLEKLHGYIFEKTGQNLFFFESGAGELTDHSGGCITHAHIHCLIESIDFLNRLNLEVSLVPIPKADYKTADRKNGYIWIMNSAKDNFLCNKPLLPSQFLRYVYAQYTNSPSIWNWRKHTNFQTIENVLKTYKDIN